MKKLIAVIIAVMLMIPQAAVFADEWEPEITVTYNGELIPFNVEPRIINGRTMVPFRGIFETMGGTVSYDGATRTVSSVMDGKTLSFVIGEYEATVKSDEGEEKIAIDTAPMIVDGYTLVPVRFVAEAAGLKVNWDDWYKEVVIIDTDAWKEEICEKSDFLAMAVDMPLVSTLGSVPYETEGDMKLNFSFGLKNIGDLYDASENIPQDINVSLSIKMASDEYFDGENIKSSNTAEIDLSSFNKLIKQLEGNSLTSEDEAVINNVFKNHNINLEIIVDKDYTIYVKGKDIADIVKSFGGDDVSAFVGDSYVKIPLFAENAGVDFEKINSLWSFVEEYVYSNDMLTTYEVKTLDYMFGMIADLYSNESVKLETKEDGSFKITFDVTKEDYMTAMENWLNVMWQYDDLDSLGESERMYVEQAIQETMEILGAVDLGISGTVEVNDVYSQSSNINAYFKMTDFLIPDTENVRLSINFEISAKASAAESTKTQKIEIPENVMDITE